MLSNQTDMQLPARNSKLKSSNITQSAKARINEKYLGQDIFSADKFEREDSGIFSNVTSGPSTFVANLAQAFGMPISDEMAKKLGSTESYNAAATDLWQTLVSKYGGNIVTGKQIGRAHV